MEYLIIQIIITQSIITLLAGNKKTRAKCCCLSVAAHISPWLLNKGYFSATRRDLKLKQQPLLCLSTRLSIAFHTKKPCQNGVKNFMKKHSYLFIVWTVNDSSGQNIPVTPITHITGAVSICAWFLKWQFGSLSQTRKKWISHQTRLFFEFELDFYCLCSLQKSISNSNWFFNFLN